MLLGIFFAILLGMFTGLTLLATNLLGFLELVFVYVLFFWEKKSMRTLLKKNLVLHRDKNFMTSLINALTLGCCIFLLVSASLEVQSMAAEYADAANFDIYADVGGGQPMILPNETDPVLMKHAHKIDTFGYLSNFLDKYQNDEARLDNVDERMWGLF